MTTGAKEFESRDVRISIWENGVMRIVEAGCETIEQVQLEAKESRAVWALKRKIGDRKKQRQQEPIA